MSSESGFSYETELKDGMSGPARAEIQSLKGLQGEIRSTEAAIRGLQAEKLNYQRAGFKGGAAEVGLEIAKLRLPLSGMRSELRDMKAEESSGFFASFKESILPNIVAGELAADAIKGIGEAIVGVVEEIGHLGFETAKYIVDVAEFRENAENAFDVLLGTKEEGEKAFKGFEDLGMAIHAPTEKAERIAQDLMLQGAKNIETVKSVITAVTDLQRVGLEQGASKLQGIVEKSFTAGHLVLPKKASELGIQLPELYDALALRLHTSVANVKTEIKKGTIDAEVGIQELTHAITGGKVGDIALTKLGIGDAITDIKNAARSMFENVNIQPIVQGLENFRYLFEDITGSSGEFGEGITGVINEVIAYVGELENRIVDFGLRAEMSFIHAKTGARDFLDPTGVKSFGQSISELSTDMRDLADAAASAFAPFHWFSSGVVDDIGKIGFGISDAIANAQARGYLGGNAGGPSAEDIERAQPHAAGGVVQPAQGEVFASVAPGETIVPAGAINIPDFSQMGGSLGGGGPTVHVGGIQVEVHATNGTTATKEEMQELTEQAMDDAIERLVNELGG